MRRTTLISITAATLALASGSAQAQVVEEVFVFEARVRGARFETSESGDRIERHSFSEEDIFDFLGAPAGSRLVMEYDGEGNQMVYVVDVDDDFVGWFMYDLGASCAEGVRESSARTVVKEFCVELISLYDTGIVDGAATCRITSVTTNTNNGLRKKCHIEAIDPESGWPVELTLSGGRGTTLDPLDD